MTDEKEVESPDATDEYSLGGGGADLTASPTPRRRHRHPRETRRPPLRKQWQRRWLPLRYSSAPKGGRCW